MSERVVTVGPAGADFCGEENRAIQAAVEAVARQGGGTVKVLPGTYLLHDSVHLRSRVRLVGSGAGTILRKGPEAHSFLDADLGYGHYDISVAEPERLATGMGVTIRDNRAGGFYSTIATLTWRDGSRFGISEMLNHDYRRAGEGEVFTSFPPVSARFASDVAVRDLVIEGNRAENPRFLNSCRGGGVFLLAVRDAVIANVTVRDLNGDAISFQQCRNVLIEDCLLQGNTGNGLHPGSGSVGATMRRCRSVGNGQDGVFFCLRATYSICDSCAFIGNARHGVSIGGRDTHNAIVGCAIEGNGSAGIALREGDEAMAAHATLIARNSLADNCADKDTAEILLAGAARDVQVVENRIRRRPGSRPACAVAVREEVIGARIFGNECAGEFAEAIRIAPGSGTVLHSRPERALPVGPEAAPPGADRHLAPGVRAEHPASGVSDETWTLESLFALLPAGVGGPARAVIARAYRLAEACHRGQTRDEGTPYLSHPVGVCRRVIEGAGIHDPEVLTAALLHDVVEDSPLLAEDLAAFFTPRVGRMVAALTKDKTPGPGKPERDRAYLEQVRAADIPTRILKVADRLDNASHLHLSPKREKRRTYWEETRDHYLPLAADTHAGFHRELKEWVESFRWDVAPGDARC
ncbi:MAG: HD domain-containing protein [Armatimonadetes bacterium]|nr:HD domain-containing protein [Armatimonadota bacterium]